MQSATQECVNITTRPLAFAISFRTLECDCFQNLQQ